MAKPTRWYYWLFVFIGFVIVLALHYYNQAQLNASGIVAKEGFTTQIPENIALADTSSNIVPMPQKDRLKLYLSAFSEPSTYLCQANQWCDSANPSIRYTLFPSRFELPTTISGRSGLNIANVRIRGPSAYTLSSPEKSYILTPFTVGFYMKLNSLNFETATEEKVLIDIPAETPYNLRFYMSSNLSTPSDVMVNAEIGDITMPDDVTVQWSIPKTTLVDNTNKLLAFTYTPDTRGVKLYVSADTTSYPSKTAIAVRSNEPFYLGISEVTINKATNLDASMIAFSFFDSVLASTEIVALNTFFEQHSTGFALEVFAKEKLQADLIGLMSKVQTGEQTIQELLKKINTTTCPAVEAKQNPQSASIAPKWMIQLGASADGVSALELGKCSPLHVKRFGEPDAKEDIIASGVPATPSAAASSLIRMVQYPSSVTPTTVATGVQGVNVQQPWSTQASAPATSVTPSSSNVVKAVAPTSTSSNNQEDPAFWSQFFTFLQNQQSKNTSMTANTSNAINLNTTYDSLRQEVSTDRTQPGNLLFQPASGILQDAAKPTANLPEPGTSQSWWDKITDVFLA